jgi:hypothetical protein
VRTPFEPEKNGSGKKRAAAKKRAKGNGDMMTIRKVLVSKI